MLELTNEECVELEKRVVDKFDGEMRQGFVQLAAKVTIMTLREYERMALNRKMSENPPQSPPEKS